MGEMYLSAEDFERGDSSAAVFMKKKKGKTLLYSMMSKIRQIVWYLRRKRFSLYKRGCKLIFLDIDNLSKRNERNFASAILILR